MKRIYGMGFIVSVVGMLFLGGCASKEDRALYSRIERKSPQLRTLQQTEKVVFHQGEENETTVIATYRPGSKAYEEFVIAAYPADRLATSPLHLNGIAPLRRQKVSRADLPEALRRTLPSWYSVSRVRFPHCDTPRLVLQLKERGGTEKKLLFYKGPKYLITKPKTLHI